MPEAWNDAELLGAQREARLAHYDAMVAAAQAEDPEPDTAHLTAEAIDACGLCDDEGYRANGTVCDHIDRTDTARAGSAACRAILAKKGKR
ncbi:MAG: hypothetical protein VYA67_22140 [Actinomycetota bacterium]|nr:hypothetical protein [Actinomycetota bacterium]